MYLLGYDIGSSSIKAALVDAESGEKIALLHAPDSEMAITAHQPGWAEQHPDTWWRYVVEATKKLFAQHPEKKDQVKAIGIAYQMHGLVLVDKDMQVLRPSIIWCDGRAVNTGKKAFEALGREYCLSHMLNSPGNFTASKLKWVRDHERAMYEKIAFAMLPGDYVALKMTGVAGTTISGLSEGVFWDFTSHKLADSLLNHYGIDASLLPPLLPTFGEQGKLTPLAARELDLPVGIPISYRAGDQPNNALTLGVLEPGQVAATGGTSGVVYGVVDQAVFDEKSRVNGFAHVNHSQVDPRIGVLLCINGTGIQYNWLRQLMGSQLGYPQMEKLAAEAPIGAGGISVLPFGNGPERMLEDKDIAAQIKNINFNIHDRGHIIRAALEGIAFSFVYGMGIMKEMGLKIGSMRVGNDNLFQSDIFSNVVSDLMEINIEVIQSTGAIGAAQAAGVGVGLYPNPKKAVQNREVVKSIQAGKVSGELQQAYNQWLNCLEKELETYAG